MRKLSLGTSVSVLRNSLCWLLVVLSPLSLLAKDAGTAILRSDGGVWVNGLEISGTTAVYAGDSLETKPGFVANIDAEGSSILIQSESIVKFEGTFLSLEHGSVSVGTSTLMGVHVNCIKVDPITTERTQYDVTNVNSTVQVVAHKNDVKIEEGSSLRKASSRSAWAQSATVHEGEQAKRDETQACGAGRPPQSPANGLNQKWLEIGGGAVAGVVALCLLLCTSKGKSSVSPSQP